MMSTEKEKAKIFLIDALTGEECIVTENELGQFIIPVGIWKVTETVKLSSDKVVNRKRKLCNVSLLKFCGFLLILLMIYIAFR